MAAPRIKPSTARWIAWSVGGLSILLMVAALVIMFIDRHEVLPSDAARWSVSDFLDVAINIGVPVIGIVLASRVPQSPIGWLFLVAGLSLGVGNFGTLYGLHGIEADPGSVPGAYFMAWLSNWLWPIAVGLLPVLFLIFPTGSLRSRRWRPVLVVSLAGIVLTAFAALILATQNWSTPFVTPNEASPDSLARTLFTIWQVVFPLLFVVGFTSLLLRFRSSSTEERLQITWFVTAAAFVALFFVLNIGFGQDSALLSALSSVALLFLYAAIAIAVLKYRLYDIDVVINRAVVVGSLGLFITLVYVGLVVGVGTLVGNRQSALLSATAAAVVAIAFQPVRERAQRLANRLVYGRRATPYEVLSDFAERIAGTYSSEDVLPRMAQLVAAGTGAERATVWLRVGRELHAQASSNGPPDVDVLRLIGEGTPPIPQGETAVPVVHQGELLGSISMRMPPKEKLTPAQERLVEDVASQAGLVLSNAQLIEELRASRLRLVSVQDAERRKIERNLHDGAQQQLVALAVKQRLAAALIERDPAKAAAMLTDLEQETADAIETLRDLARGIYPPLLADQGLPAALTGQARKVPIPVTVVAEGIGRYPQPVEAAVYFCCLEALQNVTKYAQASGVEIRLQAGDGELVVQVVDDGVGFDPERTPRGSGLQNMADRMAVLGGRVEIRSRPGEGTTIVGQVPADPDDVEV
jgi:signal transduction histidine kinase